MTVAPVARTGIRRPSGKLTILRAEHAKPRFGRRSLESGAEDYALRSRQTEPGFKPQLRESARAIRFPNSRLRQLARGPCG